MTRSLAALQTLNNPDALLDMSYAWLVYLWHIHWQDLQQDAAP